MKLTNQLISKSTHVLIMMLISSSIFAQAPQKMSYQAVIRNSSNALVTNAQVGMQISILQGSATGPSVYTETQTPTTNANGLVSIEIGGGAGFDTINWANGMYFIKTETDPAGGANYTITGTSQLLSVPYALYANKSGNGDLLHPDGFSNAITVAKDITEDSYTVPSGKNFYMLSLCDFILNNDTIHNTCNNSPFIIGENQVIKGYGNEYSVVGFCADACVTPVIQNLKNGSYTVPEGKQIIMFYFSGPLLIDGALVGYTNYTPIIITSGHILSSGDNGNVIIDGYLK